MTLEWEQISLDKVMNAELSMSSLEIWCNESQERYVIIIKENDLAKLEGICKGKIALFM